MRTKSAYSVSHIYYYLGALIFWGFYLYTSLFATKVTASLGVGVTGIYLLKISFVLFYGATLVVALKSIFAIWDYATLASEKDLGLKKEGLAKIGYGLLWLLLGFVLSTAISAIRGLIVPPNAAIVTGAWKFLTIVTNYLWVVFPGVGLWNIFRGARMSVGGETRVLAPLLGKTKDNVIIAVIFSLMMTVLYGVLVFTNPERQMSLNAAIRPTYFLSDPLILLTLVIPSFFIWGIGILAAFEIDRIAPRIDDQQLSLRFRSARRNLVNGLWEVIFSSILIQILLSLGSTRLLHLGLFFILVAVYGIFFFLIIGYATIMRGVRRLLALSRATEQPTDMIAMAEVSAQ